MVFDLRWMDQFQSNQIQIHLVFNQSRYQFQRILWSSSTESRLMVNVPNPNKSIIDVQFQSNLTQNHLVFDLKLINQFKTNQFQNQLIFHLMSMNQIQKTVDKSIPNESIPESSDLDLMTMNHNLLAINQIKQIKSSTFWSSSHVLHIKTRKCVHKHP